jgi:hypothetical protein
MAKIYLIIDDVHIKLNSDQVMRWVRYIDINEATVHEPLKILRKRWLESAQKLKIFQESNKKSKNKNIDITQSQPLPTSNIYIQQPPSQPNLVYGFGNMMYPPGMMQSPFGYGYHNAFNNPFPSFLPPESTPNVAAAATHNPTPSSPVSVGSDPVKRLENYLR